MAIDFDTFLNWAESRFGDVVVSGDEIKVNSIFDEDYKHHMWCNPKGGKKQLPHGVFHCWKTDKSGNLITLVRLVDKCSYDEAIETLGSYDIELADLERRLEAFMATRTEVVTEEVSGFKLPDHTFPINSLPASNFWRVEAEVYLTGRKLPIEDFQICLDGEYKNRIIIPYYDQNQKLIYWNGRYLNNSDKIPKYLGPKKDCGVGKSDVIYMAQKWPKAGAKLHIAEGEFDAKSLHISGFNGGAIGGSKLEEKQVEMLRPYIPVLCFDTDTSKKRDAGGVALLQIGDTLKTKGFNEVYFVRPPKQFKDWNKMLVELGPKMVSAYIKMHEKLYDTDTSLQLQLGKI